jgi:hypothetical protein
MPGHTYSPPQLKIIPPFLPETTGQAFALFRHYENRERGVNLYVWSDNTVTTDYPVSIATGTSTVKIPQPLQAQVLQPQDPTNPATGGEQPPLGPLTQKGAINWDGPYPYVEIWDVLATLVAGEAVYQYKQQIPWCVSWFRGGVTEYQISDAMYAILHSAGYAAYLT